MEGWNLARQHSLIVQLCCFSLLFASAGAVEPDTVSAVYPQDIQVPTPPSSCESSYQGITYCVEDGGDIHIAIIDLNNPYIRFEVVMADDVSSVNTTRRERTEGLTVKNGRRLDDKGGRNQNPNALWRSSLAISRVNHVSLGRKSAEELEDPRAYRERFYNAVGGGPLILSHGVIIPNTVACLVEGFPVGACRRRIQTAVGLSEDERWLYLAVGEGRDIQGFAHLLQDYGAFTAIKLDGGGSSQLWYDGEMRYDTDRAVGNALMVFYSPVPRHDARFRTPSQIAIVEPGEPVELEFQVENTGYVDWEPDLGYRFKNVQGWPVLGSPYQRLPRPVSAGGSLISSWTIVAPRHPGVYEVEWQLMHRTEPIGSRLWLGMVVLPVLSDESGFKEKIESRLAKLRYGPGFDQEWRILRQELEQEIRRAVKRELRAALSDETGRVRAPVEAEIRARWMPLIGRLAW
jgi:hypothetical protein